MAETKEKKSVGRYGTVVAACICPHKVQDKLYGNGRRLHNLCARGVKRRCTVCSKETSI